MSIASPTASGDAGLAAAYHASLKPWNTSKDALAPDGAPLPRSDGRATPSSATAAPIAAPALTRPPLAKGRRPAVGGDALAMSRPRSRAPA
eukprot:366456-Chlamydomonas_euryale.AAC.7